MRPPAVQSRPAPRFVGANHIKAFMASFWHIRVSTARCGHWYAMMPMG